MKIKAVIVYHQIDEYDHDYGLNEGCHHYPHLVGCEHQSGPIVYVYRSDPN